MAVGAFRVFMDHCDRKSENLLRICDSLNYAFKVLAEKCLYLGLHPNRTLVWSGIWVWYLEIDFYEGLWVIRFGAELCFRRSLQRCDHLGLSKCIAELKLTVWVKCKWVNSQTTELTWYVAVPAHSHFRQSDRYFKLVVVVVGASLQSIQADHLNILCIIFSSWYHFLFNL